MLKMTGVKGQSRCTEGGRGVEGVREGSEMLVVSKEESGSAEGVEGVGGVREAVVWGGVRGMVRGVRGGGVERGPRGSVSD